MNITVENLAPCKKLVRVELEAKVVDEMFESITKDFQKQAALPGFRPGKAPRAMVLKKYEADIKEEARRKLIGDSYRSALKEKNIEAIAQPDIEEIQFEHGQPLLFAATVETAPEFELPEYKGLLVRREAKFVTDADVDRALELLARQQVKFETVPREARTGDVAVVNYTGTVDGKIVEEEPSMELKYDDLLMKKSLKESPSKPRLMWEVMPASTIPPAPSGFTSVRSSVS